MAYVDEGEGVPVVLVHGTPSCSTEWRQVMARLRPSRRVIAVDHLGFGQSERPADWRTYSFAWHRANLRALLAKVVPGAMDLVVHDVGGPIALPLVVELGGRVRSLTIVQSWLWDLAIEPTFSRGRALLGSPLFRWLYLSWNFSPRVMVKAAWGTRTPLDRALHGEFLGQFPTRASRAGLWGFVRALLDEGASLEPEAARLAATGVPTTIVWGSADSVVKPLHLARWREVLPGARVVELADVGHFPQLEAPGDVAAAIAGAR
jgi:haloalkane dehalogenase